MIRRKIRFIMALFVIASMLLASTLTVHASTGIVVKKVVFKDLETTAEHVCLGGLRFFNQGSMIDSGAVTSYSRTMGETEAFIVNTSTAYDMQTYYPPYFVDTSRPQIGTYSTGYYLSQAGPGVKVEVSVEFKSPMTVDKIEFIASPEYPDRGIDKPFVIDVYASDDSVTSYNVTPSQTIDEIQSVTLEGQAANVMLGIESTSSEINAGDTITVDVAIQNASNIYAEDFVVQYDPTAFELMSEAVSDAAAMKILHTEKTSGQARYIVASNGATYGINGTDTLVTLTFKAKSFNGTSQIQVLSGLVANGEGGEITADCSGKSFTIHNLNVDVNNNGTFSLGDLAIASRLLATDASAWGTYKPDVNTSGAVDDVDLSAIVQAIL